VDKNAAIIVSRMSSTRLPGKASIKIDGRETLAHVIDRIKSCNNIDDIVVATSTNPEDDKIEEIAYREGISVYRGSLEDVAMRILQAAKKFNINNIVRVTADDLIRDELMIDKGIERLINNKSDTLIMENMPYGTASEIFNFESLERIINHANDKNNTGFLEYYLKNEAYFNVSKISSDYIFNEELRMTLDYDEDLIFFNKLFKIMKERKIYMMLDILKAIDKNKSIININKDKTIDYDPSSFDWTLS
jgi:spore coat polysaccharide biosynthesis protein SpsF